MSRINDTLVTSPQYPSSGADQRLDLCWIYLVEAFVYNRTGLVKKNNKTEE